ncbi:amidohydrolase family protein [Phytohabitans kaempferiae]|uniref:Amidohydrolase family protein n=1 Tax=Phytohabitans kaempferiae TaxID=1620943 RepID=A0ABV6LYX4_9ACTN
MIVDVHGHLSAPPELYAYQANLIAHRGSHGRGRLSVSDDRIREAVTRPIAQHGGISHLDHLASGGIDVQLISPRPYTMMHSEQPPQIVEWFAEATNDLIHRTCELFPDRFRGVAGLPQNPATEPATWVRELRRCVTDLGFVGCLLNPDPNEGQHPPAPGLGDRYWYPLYEALCELDVPALVHSAGCRPPAREPFSLHFIVEETIAVASLARSSVFTDFPDLKIVVSHGGGAIPYQIGRFVARGGDDFMASLRRLWFDTCLYTKDSLELLLRTVGPDRCLFGTEKPGTGSAVDPATGRWFDDVRALLDEVDWLDGAQREALLGGNARSLYRLAPAPVAG